MIPSMIKANDPPAGSDLRNRLRLLSWWIGMASLIASQAYSGSPQGNLAKSVFIGCMITWAVIGVVGFTLRARTKQS
jgi:hypothetical protein